jgi:cAMP-dependent protein kinase regulator
VRAQHLEGLVGGPEDSGSTNANHNESDANSQIPFYKKSQASMDFLTKALSSDANFLFSSLSPDELQLLIGAMAPQKAKAEAIIIQQGDIGDYFYALERGRVDFIVEGNLVGHCGPGASFGELALLYDAPRAATCKANEECHLWRVDQHTFRYMLAKTQTNQNQHLYSILRKVPFLSELEDSALSKIIDALVTLPFPKGDQIVRKGQVGDMFYILDQGTARIHDIGFGDTQFDDVDLSSGAYFGERALLTGEPRAANVTATSDCVCLTLSRESFEATLGPLQELMDRAMTKRVLVCTYTYCLNEQRSEREFAINKTHFRFPFSNFAGFHPKFRRKAHWQQ